MREDERDLKAYFESELEREAVVFARESSDLRRHFERRRMAQRQGLGRRTVFGEVLLAGAAAMLVVGLGLSLPESTEEGQVRKQEQLVVQLREAKKELEMGIRDLRSAIAVLASETRDRQNE